MSVGRDRYELVITPTAPHGANSPRSCRRPVACAAYEFILGPLLENPYRVGKRLRPPLDDRFSTRRGTYRVIYRIDEARRTVGVLDASHSRPDRPLAARCVHRPGLPYTCVTPNVYPTYAMSVALPRVSSDSILQA